MPTNANILHIIDEKINAICGIDFCVLGEGGIRFEDLKRLYYYHRQNHNGYITNDSKLCSHCSYLALRESLLLLSQATEKSPAACQEAPAPRVNEAPAQSPGLPLPAAAERTRRLLQSLRELNLAPDWHGWR
jgi:hypothetical protein